MAIQMDEVNLNLGQVVFISQWRAGELLRRVIRRVGSEDILLLRRNKKREQEALSLCQRLVERHRLNMKLVRVAYLHGGNKAIFYFTADGRVDFRALVRDLAKQLHVRIEMRQIGVRDESKMLGGIGICGQQLCCARFLNKFAPVSIKMAKNQSLALNPQKLSGLCGRLMCCLVYEDDIYQNYRKNLPKVGISIDTPQGLGKVIDLDILRKKVLVQIEDRSVRYTLDELQGKKKPEEAALELLEEEEKAKEDKGNSDQKESEAKKRDREQNVGEYRTGPKRAVSGTMTKEAGRDKESEKREPSREQDKGSKTKEAGNLLDRKRRKRRSRRRSRRRKKRARTSDNRSSGSDGYAHH